MVRHRYGRLLDSGQLDPGEELEDARGFGWTIGEAKLDWARLVEAKDRELDRLNGIYVRMLRDAGDKVSASDRQPVEAAIEQLKRALEKNDFEQMKHGIESLNTAQHKIAEAMYRSAQGGGGGQQSAPGSGGSAAGGSQPGDVIDAEVVEEEKK